MRVFFWLCFALLLPGLLLRLNVGGAGVLATDILLPLFCGVWLLDIIVRGRTLPPFPTFALPGGIFLLFALVTFFLTAGDLSAKEQFLSFSHWVRLASLLLFGVAAADLFRTRAQQIKLLRGLACIVGGVLVLGVVQLIFLPDIGSWSTEGGWDPHQGRLLGTWMDPNFLAGFFGMLLPITLAAAYEFPQARLRILLLSTALFVGLILTFSRSGLLAALAGIGFFVLLKDPRMILLSVAILGVGIMTHDRTRARMEDMIETMSSIVLGSDTEIDPTARLRIESWQESLELGSVHPLIGVGFNSYRYRAQEAGIVEEGFFSGGGADSTLLTIFVTNGFIGVLLFAWIFVSVWWRGLALYFHKRHIFPLGIASGVVALFVHSVFVNSLLFPFILMVFFTLAAVLMPLATDQTRRGT